MSYAEFATDWETRKYFVSYSSNVIRSVAVDGTFIQKARIGYAPYIAEYGSLHTWLMYETQHMPENSKSNIARSFLPSCLYLESPCVVNFTSV